MQFRESTRQLTNFLKSKMLNSRKFKGERNLALFKTYPTELRFWKPEMRNSENREMFKVLVAILTQQYLGIVLGIFSVELVY